MTVDLFLRAGGLLEPKYTTYVTGPGDDYVRDHTSYSGGGNNTFVYNKGDGHDRVEYFRLLAKASG